MLRLLFLALLAATAAAQSPTLRETWDNGYGGRDANGADVLGYWKFDAGTELKDASGKGHDLAEHGAKLAPKGRFGGALESFPGFPVEDKSHSLQTGSGTGLSPKGALTIEMWLAAKPDFAPGQRCYLLDKKYVSDDDYQWTLSDADKGGFRRMTVTLGFGAQSQAFYSDPLRLEPGAWRHVAFTYDANGTGRFYVDGQAWGGGEHAGAKAISAGRKPLAIGDRLGSNHGGFPGYIDEVRICDGVLEFGKVRLQILTSRTVWRRMEERAHVTVVCTNTDRQKLSGSRLVLGVAGASEHALELPALAPGAEQRIEEPIETRLKAATYRFRARLEIPPPNAYATENSVPLEIVNRPLPKRMPVVMWGNPGDDFTLLKELGFTHCLGLNADYAAVWKAGKPVPPGKLEETRRMLDRALAADVGLIASVSPVSFLESMPELLRVDRAGKPYERKDICASLPQLPAYFENVGKSVAEAYGDHPAFAAALIDTEVRDNSRPSFNAVDVANYRAFSGVEIPPEVNSRTGVNWQKLPNFPADRVIADDDPILKYYRWFWTGGDGWNALHSALHDGVKSAHRDDVWTFFDPAVRAPSIHGSGGRVNVLSHWTYTYPDPQRIGLATDELLEMARVNGVEQSVMKMTQLIWYRSQTAPSKSAANGPQTPVAWEDHDPDAAYITNAPMHLREALWTKLSRPVKGIMYHGWGSLVEQATPGGYRYTNPHTQHELKRLLHEVVEPLGPTLMQLEEPRPEVGFLESFTSQMFAGRGGYGSNLGWSADVWLALEHAHVQSDVLFEESLPHALERYRVLVAPECDVLPRFSVQTIRAWQKKGGVLIGDELLCPGLEADVRLQSFKRVKRAAEDKASTLAVSGDLAQALRAHTKLQAVDCDNPEVIVHQRAAKDARYVFAINDRREAGSYVGQHGLVLENGVPSHAKLTFENDGAAVYDLAKGTRVPTTRADAHTSIELDLGPAEGRLFLVMQQAIARVQIHPFLDEPKPGASATVAITVEDVDGKAIGATIPMRLSIRDPNGRLAEGSGYYGASDGHLLVKLDLAPNDDPGVWEITARELASGQEATSFLRVNPILHPQIP
jgi:hypothetical protein